MRKIHASQSVSLMIVLLWTVAGAANHPTKFFLTDEGKKAIHYIDLEQPANSWTTETEGGLRDLQLVGNNRVMLSCGGGFLEFDVSTGERLRYVKVYNFVGSARRLANGNTLISKKSSDKVVVVDTGGTVVDTITLEKPVHRMMRTTERGTLIYGYKHEVIEADTATGDVVWSASVKPLAKEVYAAVRVSDSCVWVSTGYGNSLIRIDGDSTLTEYTAREEDHSHEFAGFQVLPEGRVVVANWQGHGDGHGSDGHQFLQFDVDSREVNWFWEQESDRISSINNILVVDGLDPAYMWTDAEGILKSPSGEVTVLVPRNALENNGRQSDWQSIEFNSPGLAYPVYDLRGALIRFGISEIPVVRGYRLQHNPITGQTRRLLPFQLEP